MANSPLFAQLAQVQQQVQRSLGTLVPATLHHGDMDTDLMVRREGPAGITVASDRDEPASRWRITIYDQVLVQPDDEISWGPDGYDKTDPVYRHGVVRVRGLSKADESRYVTVAETN